MPAECCNAGKGLALRWEMHALYGHWKQASRVLKCWRRRSGKAVVGRAVVMEGCSGVHGHWKPASRVFASRGCVADESGAFLNMTGHLPLSES